MEFTYDEKIMLSKSTISILECEFGLRDDFEKELMKKFVLNKISGSEYSKKLYEHHYDLGNITREEYEELLQTI